MTVHSCESRQNDADSRRFVCTCGWESKPYVVDPAAAGLEASRHVERAAGAEADLEFEQERQDNPALARAEAYSFGEGE